MKNKFIILLLLPISLFSKSLTQDRAEQFIQLLVDESPKIINFIATEDLQISNRLGIHYANVEHKFLISYDIDPEIRKDIQNSKLTYSISIHQLSENYSKLNFSIKNIEYQKSYFFQDGKLIHPNRYFCKSWKRINSKYFKFIISDSTLFNSYCVRNLDNFFHKIVEKLNLSKEQIERIKSQKVYYYLCKDSEEIKNLTGFNTRGMYNLAYDFIITTFNAHYHELMHLLINFKIGKLPLYTHPFFQEGFAVAFGGRGGKEPGVILNLGLFLHKSGMLEYTALLSKKDFYQFDTSLSYPASGFYNRFLVNKIGIDEYLKLYIKYSGNSRQVENMTIRTCELPSSTCWNNYIDGCSQDQIAGFKKASVKKNLIYANSIVNIYQDFEQYYFQLYDAFLIKTDPNCDGFQSKKFKELAGCQKYDGEKYVIMANGNEISVYNLYTNNLVANYVSSFSIPNMAVPFENGYYLFALNKYIFDENLKELFTDN